MSFGADHMGRSDKNTITTEKLLPVLIGENYEHVMAQATIEQTAAITALDDNHVRRVVQPAKVIITIVAEGPQAQEIGDFVAAQEVVALSFAGVPVRPVIKE